MADERIPKDTLPPSPPRPDRREAAVAAAMRRFDGEAETVPTAPVRRRRLAERPQLGVLAAAALVVVVGVPLWLSGDLRRPAVERAPAARDTLVTGHAPPVTPPVAIDRPPAVASDRAASVPAPPSATSSPPAQMAPSTEAQPSAPLAPAPALVAAPPAAVAALRAAPELAAAPPPPAHLTDAQSDASDVVVTSRRTSAREATVQRRRAALGDWNRCTVDDPRRDAAACRPRGRVGKAGPSTEAATLIADGLAAAWDDDRAGAIAAFDRAIAVSPRSSAAWLNRGMVHADAGDNAMALSDLDKAVRFAPREARARFQRSLVLEKIGKSALAEADTARAEELDQRYDNVIR